MNRTTMKVFSGVAGAGLVLAIAIAGNALLAGVRWRKDLTDEKLYSLSPGTVEMVRGLQRPVALKFYFSRSNAQVPIPLKNFAQRAVDFLREVEMRSGGLVSLEVLDPRPDTETEEWAQRYGLMPQALGGIGMPPELYLGLVAVSGTKEASIPLLAPALEPQMEYLVVRLVQEVTRERRPRLGLLSGLPVAGAPAFRAAAGRPDWLFVSELKAQGEVETLPADLPEVPENVDALVVVHPKGIGENALFAIDQYLLKGGRVLAFVDPVCLADEEAAEETGTPGGTSDLNRLTRAWGVEVDPRRVVADPAAATAINVGEGRAERLPAWLTLRGSAHVDREDITTEALETLMLPFAGRITGEPAEGLELRPLLRASDEAVTLDAFTVRYGLGLNTAEGEPAAGAWLAVRLTGRFPTAFPEGAPGAGEDPAEGTAGSWRKEAEKDGVVVLVADADLLSDRFLAQTMRFFGQTVHQPINDNLSFVLNQSEQLTGDPALVGLRSRGRFDRPFERVLAMERTAQARWQEEEGKLQEKLMATQQRLNELQAAKSEDQQLVLSSAQRAEVERFRQERFETQRQLTEVRRNLRRDIERLGLGLKLLNMAGVPLLVAVFGIAYGWVRRRRAAA